MTLAGLDPSGGAGLLADIKTFEQHRVYGFGVCTALTVQTASRFISVDWLPLPQIMAQAQPLLAAHTVRYCKIGIMPDVQATQALVRQLKELAPGIHIILDPVLKASAGFTFQASVQQQAWQQLLRDIYLLTPNYNEALLLSGARNGEEAARELSAHCAVLLKGGHRTGKPGYDTLYTAGEEHQFAPGPGPVWPKHGSGCILSAAITASLAAGLSLIPACANGKAYTENVLSSHSSLTGYHYR